MCYVHYAKKLTGQFTKMKAITMSLYKIISISLVFSLLSCSSSEIADSKDVNQSQIYQKYYVTWDAEDESTYVEAVFRFGGDKGTSLILSEPSTITVNGKELNGKNRLFRGYIYSRGSIPFTTKEINYAFTDTEKKRYKNGFQIVPIGILSVADSFSKNNNLHFELEGEPLATYEEFHLKIKDSEGVEAVFVTDVKGSSRIFVEAAELSELSPGQVNIQISRIMRKDLRDCPEIGGFTEIRYLSKIYSSKISYKQISNI